MTAHYVDLTNGETLTVNTVYAFTGRNPNPRHWLEAAGGPRGQRRGFDQR